MSKQEMFEVFGDSDPGEYEAEAEAANPDHPRNSGSYYVVGIGRKTASWIKWALHRVLVEAHVRSRCRIHTDI